MALIVGVCRYALPVLAFIILVKCFMTLLIGHPVNENYAYIEDSKTGEKIALNLWETSIGKSKTCDIMLGYDVISRFHAVICRRVDGWYVFDTLSKNGTYIKKFSGDKPVKVEAKGTMIEHGNIVCFSNREYRFIITNDPVVRVGKKKKFKNADKYNDAAEPKTSALKNSDKAKESITMDKPDIVIKKKSLSQGGAYEKTISGDVFSNSQQNKKSETIITQSPQKQVKVKQAALINQKTGYIYLLVENAVTIGSLLSSDIRISNPTVSRLHAVMTKSDGKWHITDRNSTNGTTVNDSPISGTTTLKNNDIVGISNEKFTFTDDYR